MNFFETLQQQTDASRQHFLATAHIQTCLQIVLTVENL